jgi:putative transcriptional regulator
MAKQPKGRTRSVEDEVLSAAHRLASALHDVGAMDDITMREMDALCLAPPKAYGRADVVRIRRSTRMSQPVFAKLLGVGKSSVVQWESGERKPSGTALRVLELLDTRHSSPLLEVRASLVSA